MRNKKGIVTSDKADKTIVVTVHRYATHAKYKKKYRISKKYHVNDPENKFKAGDQVTIYESTPISKLKRWTVVEPEQNQK